MHVRPGQQTNVPLHLLPPRQLVLHCVSASGSRTVVLRSAAAHAAAAGLSGRLGLEVRGWGASPPTQRQSRCGAVQQAPDAPSSAGAGAMAPATWRWRPNARALATAVLVLASAGGTAASTPLAPLFDTPLPSRIVVVRPPPCCGCGHCHRHVVREQTRRLRARPLCARD